MTNTSQDIFNRIYSHRLRQGWRSMGTDGRCAYRGINNTRCPVGVLIADEYYTLELEGQRASEELVIEAVEKSINIPLGENERQLLVTIQEIHDNCHPFSWEYHLEQLAYNFNLSIPQEPSP